MKRVHNSIDLTGRYFGLFKVLFYYDTIRPYKVARARWFCECACGNYKVITGDRLKTGRSKSCGCLNHTHNMTGTKIYNTWKSIKRKKTGICEDWKDFNTFYKWSTENNYAEELFLSRIDRNFVYSPDNCRWTQEYLNGPAPVIKEGDLVPTYSCLGCGKSLKRWNQKYCSTTCQVDTQYKKRIDEWRSGEHNGLTGGYQIARFLRKYLFDKYNNSCAICGWNKMNLFSKRIPLEVEHIDGDYTNNKEENLILLCPNCHSLTATYKGANLGNGRKERSKYNL
jgi:hypothetical protein